MRGSGLQLTALVGGLFLAACADSTGPASPSLECSTSNIQSLAVGQHVVIDPAQSGACVRIPPAGAAGAEHLYVPVATEASETDQGVSAPYAIQGSSAITAVSGRSSVRARHRTQALPSQRFHDLLRRRERELSRSADPALLGKRRSARLMQPPPTVGEQRTFNVCATTTCETFTPTSATADVVGARVAVFVDDAAPSPGYTQADLVHVAELFDNHLYPIDTTAFGRESDIDANGVVIVLLTHQVNLLSPNCDATQSVILGFFFGADLLPRSAANPGSNEAEIFYGLVPDPNNPDCGITEDFALSHLPSTLVHEFQHMISFNQHRLERGGTSEDTWLNEGLSHFAEELAGRKVPDSECPVSGSCFSDFLGQGDLVNAFEYLQDPEAFFLIEPGNSSGSLEERGANWLFVRWLADHFATDTLFGTDLTRRLVMTVETGAENVQTQTGVPFSNLVAEWQLTNYLDDLPGFSAASDRLRYRTWNFRDIAAANALPFPLVPDSTAGPDYSHTGILRAGSGKHVRVVQPPGFAAVDLQLSGGPGNPFPSETAPRIALVRIR